MRNGVWLSLLALVAGGVMAMAGEPAADTKAAPSEQKPAPAVPAPRSAADALADTSLGGYDWWGTTTPGWGADRMWLRADYLLWWTKSNPVSIPLVTVGDPADDRPGALGQPGTRTLIGNETIDVGGANGVRLTFGGWLNDEQNLGAELTYFFLGGNSGTRGAASNGDPGTPVLAFPYRDTNNNIERSGFIAFPQQFAGTALVNTTTEFQGLEVNGVFNLTSREGFRILALAGLRHLYLHESLTFSTSSPTVPTIPGEAFLTHDELQTYNHFYGVQLGARAEYMTGNLYFDITGKLAIGGMRQILSTNGTLLTNDFNGFGPLQQFAGGYLIQPSNLGRFSTNDFAWVPELNLNVAYCLGQRAKFLFGYSILGVSNVLRPGNQLGRNINPTQSPTLSFAPDPVPEGRLSPLPKSDAAGFWAQGLNFGLELRF